MTNEEKQALIGLCRIEIKRWKAASEANPNMRYMVELMEVALTALTEQPHHNGMMMLSHKLAAAEAKLAEFEKQEPVGDFYEDGPGNWWQIRPHDKVPYVTPLFDRPAPAINLAELVPEEMPDSAYEIMSNKFGSGACMISDDMWEACRAEILRRTAEMQRLNANSRP